MSLLQTDRLVVTIPNGSTISEVILRKKHFDGAASIHIVSPATYGAAASVVVQVVRDEKGDLTAGSNFCPLTMGPQDNLQDLSLNADEGRTLFELAASGGFRLVANVNPTQDLNFILYINASIAM